MESIKVFLTPNYNSTSSEIGIDEFEDYSDKDNFRQGKDADYIEVDPGETFTISQKYEGGYIQCNGKKYKVIFNDEFDDDDEYDEDEDQIELGCGKYKFHADGVRIERLDTDNYFKDDFDNDFDDDFDEDFGKDFGKEFNGNFDDEFDEDFNFNYDEDDDY